MLLLLLMATEVTVRCPKRFVASTMQEPSQEKCSSDADKNTSPVTPESVLEPVEEAMSLSLQLPPDIIRKIKEYCFSFDTFFVTATENYQANGVLFKGNLRGVWTC
jgi:hypothetical protein